jgi:nicotinate-nucleotide adenylyltransferase
MKTIALFGGSFDPPHIGHEAIVKTLLNFKDIDKVVVMPTFLNPFKSGSIAPSELRLKWLHDIFDSYERVEINIYEVDLKKKTPTIQSVKYLLTKYKKIYLVIGADNLATLTKWTEYDELKKMITFIVCTRDDIEIPDNMLQIKIDESVSSTDLREHLDTSKLVGTCAQEIKNYYTKEKNEN